MNFLIMNSESYTSRYNVLEASIVKYHPEALRCHVDAPNVENGYIPGFAKERLQRVLERFKQGWSHCVVLGADCEIKSNLFELEEALYNNDIVLIPHVMKPNSDRLYMAQLYRTGHANADIIAFKNTPNAIACIEWLISVTEGSEPENGIFYEQTWLSAVPFLFPRVAILRDVRYNVGYWTGKEDFMFWKDDIRLIQYSGFEKGKPERMSKYYSGPNIDGELLKLYQSYDERI